MHLVSDIVAEVDIEIHQPIGGIAVTATKRGLQIVAAGGTPDRWSEQLLASSVGAQLAIEIEQLLDRGLAEVSGESILLPWESYDTAISDGLGIAQRGVSSSPFLLAIDRESELGRPDFFYRYQYLLGGREAPVDRAGYFLRHRVSQRIFTLDARAFALVDAMDRYNAVSPAERSSADAWEAFATIRKDADALGVRMDEYLASNTVVIPSSIALDYVHHQDGSLSFVPACPELAEGEFATVFQRNRKAEKVYSLDASDGRRIRIILDDRQRAVLERMTRVRCVTGEMRRQAEEEPEAFFDGILEDVEIRYGSRVTGVGALTFTPMPANRIGASFLDQVLGSPENESQNRKDDASDDILGHSAPSEVLGAGAEDTNGAGYASITLHLASGEGDIELTFDSSAALRSFREKVASAVVRGSSAVEHDGLRITVDEDVIEALTRPAGRRGPDARGKKPQGQKYLLIYTNEDVLEEGDITRAEAAMRKLAELPFSLPDSLASEVILMPHQVEGVRWLSRCDALSPDRRGALLADDMGLGKTLQILTHLARVIEAGGIKDRPDQGDEAPWRPILIVAPLMLVENEIWIHEMTARFKFDGEIFRPWLTLHGSAVSKVKAAAVERGRETVLGIPLLDAEKLMKFRVIVTSYETVVNYQHSFAQLKENRPLWSVIVADEAQRYKMPNTKVSVAMKAVPSRFHIASTGTPVENRLLDLWNIVDTLQPALLGTATEFSRTFEAPLRQDLAQQRLALDGLRSRLHYGTPGAFIIRRSKSELTDLPEKVERRVLCRMSRAEHDAHVACLDLLREEGTPGRHLAVLQRLALLSQHSLLTVDGIPDASVDQLVAASSKIRAVLEVMEEIRSRGEKVILFARHVAVQNLLAYVIGRRMSIRVPIVNGSMAGVPESMRSSDTTRRTRDGRKRVLDDFKSATGFGAIVLSPFVAGVGLTITEANHVIHYGRWWNPAVEAQATDRAYRIGQTRPVTVYFPILEDPWATTSGSSFDEVLDKLLTRKLGLAKDFLHPVADEDNAASELRADLLGGSEDAGGTGAVLDRAAIDRLSAVDFEALVAAVLRAEGGSPILTCQAGDGGADVVTISSDHATAIQVKHVRSEGECGIEAISDVLAARDTYCGRLGGVWKATLITSGRAGLGCRREASHLGVEIVEGYELARRVIQGGVSLGDLVRAGEQRSASFDEGIRRAAVQMKR